MKDVDTELRRVAAHLAMRTAPGPAPLTRSPVQPDSPAPKWLFELERSEPDGLLISVTATRIA